MQRLIVVSAIVLLGSGALALWLPAGNPPPRDARGPAPVLDSSKPLEARVLELERAVNDERQARQLLQEEVLFLTDELEALRGDGEDGSGGEPVRRAGRATTGPEGPASVRSSSRRNDEAGRIERFIAAGMSPEQARWVTARESRLQLELLQARHDAERNGNYQEYQAAQAAASQAFQDELGPQGYERYLEGSGRSTAVAVTSVMDASPAQAAGLRPGDEIRRYAGERVYSMSDLNRATLQGVEGETVYVEIVRDGLPMQIALPRGPVGITGGRRGRR